MAAEKPYEPLTDAELLKLEDDLQDITLGYNSANLARRYGQDVRRLLAERRHLLGIMKATEEEHAKILNELYAKAASLSVTVPDGDDDDEDADDDEEGAE